MSWSVYWIEYPLIIPTTLCWNETGEFEIGRRKGILIQGYPGAVVWLQAFWFGWQNTSQIRNHILTTLSTSTTINHARQYWEYYSQYTSLSTPFYPHRPTLVERPHVETRNTRTRATSHAHVLPRTHTCYLARTRATLHAHALPHMHTCYLAYM